MVMELWRFDPSNSSSLEQMAFTQTSDSDNSDVTFVVYDDEIEYPQIDNENFVYAIKLYVSQGGTAPNITGSRGAIIEYEI